MTQTEIIKQNEQSNDGRQIHLYPDSSSNAWIAYGVSAFQVRLFVKSNRWHNNFRDYSESLGMPYTMITSKVLNSLMQQPDIVSRQEQDYIFIQMPTAINFDAYNKWSQKLQQLPAGDDEIVVETHVSHLVPKTGFIADNMTDIGRNFKRGTDALLALLAMIIFSPLYLIVYIAVRKEDGGPAIYKQERIGRFGRPFYIYKFRSMRLDAEKFGPQLSHSGGDDDPRLTKVGKFIRAHHLDELPQLWNVFCGDMAFIGPRPEHKFYIDQILEHDKRYEYLYQIRPGVTSYATLYNGYTDTMEKMLRRLEYDLYYLGHRSWWFDFKVLFNTFCAIVFGKKF